MSRFAYGAECGGDVVSLVYNQATDAGRVHMLEYPIHLITWMIIEFHRMAGTVTTPRLLHRSGNFAERISVRSKMGKNKF